MVVFWSVNVVLPEAAGVLGLTVPPYGGWLEGLRAELIKQQDIQLLIAAPFAGRKLEEFFVGSTRYFLVPKALCHQSSFWFGLFQRCRPDIVHIHGTEAPYNPAIVKACCSIPAVISIQGVLSSIAQNYSAGMSERELLLNVTPRDLFRFDTMRLAQKRFLKLGRAESSVFKAVRYAVGRTPYDYAFVKAVNPNIQYFHCDEALRDSFYKTPYDIAKIQRHSVFMSQSLYPIKGLHMLLRAAQLLKPDYPDIKIYVAGHSLTTASLMQKAKCGGYTLYIARLLKELGLESSICFTGVLDEARMAQRLAETHVFALPSVVENSSNSLAEAMLAGVPCVAAYTGGTPYMLEQGRCGLLYPFIEYPMLAQCIRRIFESDELALELSIQAGKTAALRHEKSKIVKTTLEIYKQILNNAKAQGDAAASYI